METNKIFGLRLKQLRKEKGITLDALADSIGTTKTTLSRYENGTRSPKISILTKLAEYFKVDVTWLSGLDNNENEQEINITPIFTKLTKENKQDVYNYAEQKLAKQENEPTNKIAHLPKKDKEEVIDLAAHSEIDGRVYSKEEIKGIMEYLDQFIDE
ncbi:helix-turn-helix domain-containing protein [Enterococcus faecalis]|uniref:helix-turn-helix domain-containing protein n=1 Tax=Enterococcus TaxID=1350 RepID=UPI000459A787|nr:helix-turn-helix transcriptional regulator [Enterococcus faecalis]EGO8528067.1 XRE family transcriptional regulator [Enterococcus faecalis]EHB4974681.1 helix-turn-helix transcriptional regulator [Enterococcus faecalis]EHK9418920.1 helix-turn-helix transcriptional regulator [Enterococcus faecalis]EHK9420833.1 helix-turn-helix transcriptional regulator [Enterococcus faecalis]EHS2293281.1 helix-turn-helix transcriptional regulator [Enterococcus faecalis]